MLGYINGNKIRPIFEAKAQEEWDMYDSQVMTLITNPLEHQLSETLETTPELWQEIENQYSNQKKSFSSLTSQTRNYKNLTRISRCTRIDRVRMSKICRAEAISTTNN
jgi:hypothetical protein